MVDEFRTLVMNERVTSINGTPRTELLQQYLVDPEAAKARVNEAARILLGTDGFKEVGSGQTGEKLYEFTREFAERARLNPENFRPYAEIGPTTGLTDYGYRDGHVTFREPGSTTFLDLINSRPVPTSPSWLERQMNSLRERVANNLAEAAKYDGWGPEGERVSPNLARLSALGRALAHAGTVLMAYDIATTVNAAVKKFAANEIEAGSKLLAELAGRLTLGLRGAQAGGAVGSAIGALLGPAGALLGGIIGGVVGAVAGTIAGNELVDQVWKGAKKALGFLNDLAKQILDKPNLLPPSVQAAIAAFLDIFPSPATPGDPLVFKFGAGLPDLTSVIGSSAYFDYDGQGYTVQTGWIAPSDALLQWLDSEGNLHLLGARSGNGFADLAAMDGNADGNIDAADAAFDDLRLWFDIDQDGSVDAGELETLAEVGVSAIDLDIQETNVNVNGNAVLASATFHYGSGQVGTVHEVNFATNPVRSFYTPPAGFQYDPMALSLPQLRGYGLLADLNIAMSLDSALGGMVAALVLSAPTMTAADFKEAFAQILYRWAGAEAVDSGSRGPHVDARQFAFVLKLYGVDPGQPGIYTSRNPNAVAGRTNTQIFRDVMGQMAVRFAAQVNSALAMSFMEVEGPSDSIFDAFAGIPYDVATDDIDLDLKEVVASIVQSLPADSVEAARYMGVASFLVGGLRVDTFHQDRLNQAQVASRVGMFAEMAGLSRANIQTLVSGLLTGSGQFAIDDVVLATGTFSVGTDTHLVILGSREPYEPGATGPLTISGTGGSDAYIYWKNVGRDIVIADAKAVLSFADLDLSELAMERHGADLTIRVPETGHTLTIQGHFTAGLGLEQFWFEDGGTQDWVHDRASLLETVPFVAGSGDETIVADGGKRTLIAGPGNVTMVGGNGDNTFVYGAGDGNLVVRYGRAPTWAANVNTLRFDDLNATDVTFARSGGVLTATVNATGKVITIENEFTSSGTTVVPGGPSAGGSVVMDDIFNSGVDRVVFADGTVWSRYDLRITLPTHVGTSADDTTIATNANDTLAGGLGNDSLNGSAGNDLYVYSRGDGNDSITEGYSNGYGDNLVLHGISPGEVSLLRSGSDVTLIIAPSTPGGSDGGSILLKTETEDFYGQGVDLITFDNGTTWTRSTLRTMLLAPASTPGDDTITGFGTDDTLQGGAGNDTLQGAAGNDTIQGDTGNDTLQGGAGDDTYIYNRGDGNDSITEGYSNGYGDNLVLHGISPGEVSLLRSGSDVTLIIAPSTPGGSDGGSILLKTETEEFYGQGVDLITFDNGTTWTRSTLRTMLLASASTSGNDTITGFGTDDTLQGGAGNDTLQGAAGNDTYIYNRGDGNDTVVETAVLGTADKLTLQGINSGDVLLVRSGADILVTVAPSSAGGADGGSVMLKSQVNDANQQGIEQIVFANGVTWNNAQIKAAAGYQAEPGGVTLQAPNGGAVLISGAGNDTLLGGNGADTFMMPAGAGNDTVTASLGNGADTLRFDRWTVHDQLWFAQAGNDLIVSVIGQNQSVTVSNWYGAANNHLGQVLAGDGYTATDAGIQQLVEAMASFTPPASGQTTLPPELAASLSSTLAANWQHV
jgi:Ca2+-binding RTX toxin-like protein